MRLIAVLFLVFCLAACGSSSGLDSREGGSLPSPLLLERTPSAAGELLEFGIVALGGGAVPDIREFMGKDELYGVDLEVLPGEGTAWVVQRSGPWKDDPAVTWEKVHNDTSDDVSGSCYVAVADWSAQRWRWFDVSEPGIPGAPGPEEWWLGAFADGVQAPVSPAGYVYFATLCYGEGSQARANNGPYVSFDWDGPYLEPPLIEDAGWNVGNGWIELTVDLTTSPDYQYQEQYSGFEVYRCQGEAWDEGSAEEVSTKSAGGWVRKDESADTQHAWTYNVRLAGGPLGGDALSGLWGEPVTVLPPEN